MSELARLKVELDPEPHFSRVQWVEGTGINLPISQVEIRQSPDPKGQNCVVIHVPLQFVDLSLVQRKQP